MDADIEHGPGTEEDLEEDEFDEDAGEEQTMLPPEKASAIMDEDRLKYADSVDLVILDPRWSDERSSAEEPLF